MGFLLNFKLLASLTGILLIAFNILLFLPLPLPLIFVMPWIFLQVSQSVTVGYSLFLLATTVGLVMYIIGRKEFSDCVKDIKIASRFLIFSSLILMGTSMYFLFWIFLFLRFSFAAPRTIGDWIGYLILFSWGGLGLLSGGLWLVDGAKTREDEVPPLKKEFDFEEAWRKYPKDLFAKYVKQYPHNPSGVLEWHIRKKMKEGKTREQIIEELIKESK